MTDVSELCTAKRRRTPRRRARAVAVAALAAALVLAMSGVSRASGVAVSDLERGGATASSLAQSLVGAGVTISDVTYTGNARAAGLFTDGASSIGFESGVVMSTGKVETYPEDPPCSVGVEGPNSCEEVAGEGTLGVADSTAFGGAGDGDLTSLLGGVETHDAAALEFDFVPAHSTIRFSYVFGSEEYNDFVNQFNDGFGLFVNGTNCALVPGTGEPVSVDTVNDGGGSEELPPHNPELFRSNVGQPPPIDSQMDGLTTVLTCTTKVAPGATNHMKLAIADALDELLDSAVFIQAESISSTEPAPPSPPPSAGNPSAAPAGGVAGSKSTGGLPAPVFKQTANASPAGGVVLIELPGTHTFLTLSSASAIPMGTIVDATHGTVQLTSAKDAAGETETGLFHGGVFRLDQVRAPSLVRGGETVDLTVLALAGPEPSCPRTGGHRASVSARRGHGARRLWGNAKGNFRTEGHYASATVRGTEWLTEDTCTATIVRVTRGVVSVRDLAHRRNVLVHAPHRFAAHPGPGG